MLYSTPKLLAAILLCATGLSAQEARGSIGGRVSDTSGAVIANAKITITNTATNEIRRAQTNETGYYEVNFLEPSTYALTFETEGFKKVVRSGVELNVGSKIDISVNLEVGGTTETVEVKGEAPLLETTSASGGRVLDNRQLINLPFSDLNPFALSALAPGMQWTGQPEYRRPFDNGGTSSFNTAGGVGQNEYSMDGVTVTGTGRRVGFVPPADSVTEFKLETSNFDASQGFTSGAVINVVSRSGSNALHGSIFDQYWNQRWNATPHFTRLQWESQVAQGKLAPDSQKQAAGRSNNYGLSASGPVWIPKVINGKNKLFWTFTWNGIKQTKAETTSSVNVTVPTEAERNGDFSQLLGVANGATLYTVYDPRSAKSVNGVVTRTPFPGNVIPKSQFANANMYNAIVKLYPLPNNVPGLVTADGINNYLASGMPKNENFNSFVNRYDYNLNEKNRISVRWQYNHRLADEYDWTYETARGLHSDGLVRVNKGGSIGWLYTLSSTNILDVGAGLSRFEEGNSIPVLTSKKPSDIGLPAYMDQKAGAYTEMPRLDFNNIVDVNGVQGSYPVIGAKATTYDLHATMTTIHGNHSWKYGWQERRMDIAGASPGYSSGYFTYRNTYVKAADTTTTASNHGLDWATFILGLPTAQYVDTNDSAYYRTPRRALFFQDDWRLGARLRVSLGLRWEHEGGSTERYNRGIVASFFPDLKLPFTDLVQSAYASNPISDLAASSFKVLGGTRYLGTDGYGSVTKGVNWILPKTGIVYSFNDKTVIRAGYGMYADTYNVNNSQPLTTGYTLPTSTTISNDNGLTFCCGVGAASSLSSTVNPTVDPFPVRANGTRFDTPLQNQLGYIPQVGRGITSTNYALDWTFRPALQQRWRIGVQREIVHNLMLEVSYNGAFAHLPINTTGNDGRPLYRIDALPSSYWSTGNVRNQANDDYLNANVANPYNIKNLASLQQSSPVIYNYLTTQSLFTGTTIRRNQLLRPYGFMGGVWGLRPGDNYTDKQGSMKYRDVSFLVERRYTKGLQTSFMYTWTSSWAKDWLANEFDTAPTERPNNNVRPHRIAWSGTYEMPWGKGRTWLKDGFVSYLIGNWNGGWVFQYQNGPATTWGNVFYYGDMNTIADAFKHESVNSANMHQWFDGSIAYRTSGACGVPSGFVGFEGRSSCAPGSYHVRVFPRTLDSLREDGITNWDLKVERAFPIKPERGINARFSVDLLNAFNHTNFSGPNTDPTSSNFGKVDTQRGLSRIIQFNLRVEF
ncbi:MAG: TonB-dependent receptor [Acidobacteria bacterium]|nr:TonB-dependent receptor [Acidobacteriota bacterium]